MFFKNVMLMFRADVVLCAIYIKNRCPSNAIRNKTPYEMWYGHVPSVKHLRVFGSKSDIIWDPATCCIIRSMLGRGKFSFTLALFKER